VAVAFRDGRDTPSSPALCTGLRDQQACAPQRRPTGV